MALNRKLSSSFSFTSVFLQGQKEAGAPWTQAQRVSLSLGPLYLVCFTGGGQSIQTQREVGLTSSAGFTLCSDPTGPEWTHRQVLVCGSSIQAVGTLRAVECEGGDINRYRGPPSSSALVVLSGRGEGGGGQAAP